MSTRPEPLRSGAVEIAVGNVVIPGSVGLAQAHPVTKTPAMRKQPSAGLGPVMVHPTHSSVGPRVVFTLHGFFLPNVISRTPSVYPFILER